MQSILIIIGIVALVSIIIGVERWTKRRKTKRRKSLRHDKDTGTFYWVGMDGSSHQSKTDPSQKGGKWDQEDAGRGGGDGSGTGGWGGDGGGGAGGDGGGGGGG